jgi:hypothetical protein
MSHAMMLQDWLTLSAPTSGVVIQNESHWAKSEGYQDACFYCELTNASAATTATLYVQTSPSKDANFFDASGNASPIGSIAAIPLGNSTLGVQPLKISRWATEANQPLAKFLRWKMVFAAAGPYTLTFRLWVTLNQAGY